MINNHDHWIPKLTLNQNVQTKSLLEYMYKPSVLNILPGVSMDSSNLGAFLLIFRSAWGSSWKLSCSNASRAFLWRLRLAASSNTLFCCRSLILPRIFETMLSNGSWLLISCRTVTVAPGLKKCPSEFFQTGSYNPAARLLIKQSDTWYFKKEFHFLKVHLYSMIF